MDWDRSIYPDVRVSPFLRIFHEVWDILKRILWNADDGWWGIVVWHSGFFAPLLLGLHGR